MEQKREEARERAEAARVARAADAAAVRAAKAEAAAAARAKARAEIEQVDQRNVIPWLLELGFRIEQARRAAEYCADMIETPLEQRVRAALAYLHRARASSGRETGAATHAAYST